MTFQPFQPRVARVVVSTNRVDQTGKTTSEVFQFEQHRMRLAIQEGGGGVFGNMQAKIYGVPLSTMNVIARLQFNANFLSVNDIVNVSVWDDAQSIFLPLFSGMITYPSVEINPPESALTIEANNAGLLWNVVDTPYSNAGPISLSDVLATLAAKGNLGLDFSALIAPVPQCVNLHLTGSPADQISQLLNQYPALSWNVVLNRLRVWPDGKSFSDDAVRIAADTGMVGVPNYNSTGLTCRTLLNPSLTPGRTLQIETGLVDFIDQTRWSCQVVRHVLEPRVPGGAWFSDIAATPWTINDGSK